MVHASRRKARLRGATIGSVTGFLIAASVGAWAAAEIGFLKQVSLAEIKLFQDVAAARLTTSAIRADRLFAAFHSDDIRKPDRLSLTTRMLRLDAGAELTRGLFLFGADGHLIAATGLLPADRANVATSPWFRQALANQEADDKTAMSNVTLDPLGDTRGVILYRRLVAPTGVEGIIGTFLDEASLRRLLTPSGRFDPLTVTLGDGEGQIRLASSASQAPPTMPAMLALIQKSVQRLGLSTTVEVQTVLPRSDLLFTGTEDYLGAMSTADARRLFRNAVSAAGGVGLLILLAFLFGRGMERRRSAALAGPELRAAEERERHLAAFDPSTAVWFWFLTKDGRVSGVGGNVPKTIEDRVYGPSGLTTEQDFPRIAGHKGEPPEAWERIIAAVRHETPFTDIEADFLLGEGRVLRLSLSGQPQWGEEGGFWGIARPAMVAPVRVEEESFLPAHAVTEGGVPAAPKKTESKLAA